MSLVRLKIRVKGIRPFVWRRFLVSDSLTFEELHEIIQIVMGWENYHLFGFKFGDVRIVPPDEGWLDKNELDPSKVRLKEFVNVKGQKFSYVYDFGDDWFHDLVVEGFEEGDFGAVCVDGKRACPPEDCGGVSGYYRFMEVKENKAHPEYGELIVDWLGEEFDFEEFDLDEVNKRLRKWEG